MTYYGVNYNEIWISLNGWVSFVDPGPDPAAVAAFP